ncbi:MAG: S8 family serine peptidase [Gammaproteobacteria bacterium]|nr:S8 family serine peptidase [Gammaproteobacteria bacterium]
MRLFSTLFLFVALGSLVSQRSLAVETYTSVTDYVPGQVLVKWRENVSVPSLSVQKIQSAARSVSSNNVQASIVQQYTQLGIEQWQTDSSINAEALAKQLNQREDVVFAEPNYRRYSRLIPSDEFTSLGRYQQIQLPDAWDLTLGNSSVKVAVIDDGFDLQHEDLRDNWNLALARDFIDGDNDPSPGVCTDPDSGQQIEELHGTLVAGLLAAENNGIGIVGAAPGIQIIPLRIGCLYSVAAELQAIEYAIEKGVDIINASYGGPMYSEAERVAIGRLASHDILFVAAAGNFHMNNDLQPDYPGSIDLPNVLTVAATDASNRLVDWTQFGPTSVDVAAPGVDLVSTFPGGEYSNPLEGTSFSAPLVSGLAALLKTHQPQATFHDLKGAIMATVDPLAVDVARIATDGQVNAFSALQKIASPEPVIVISNVSVNDSSYGDGNGWADPNEVIRLDLTLENVWHKSDILFTSLHAEDNNTLIMTSSQRFAELDAVGSSKQTRSFWLRMPDIAKYSELTFRLDISESGSDKKWSRRFILPTGTLNIGQTVQHVIHRTGERQDDVHYYRVDVPNMGSRGLIFQVQALNGNPVSRNLDILVRKGQIPLFDHNRYALPDPVRREGVAQGVLVGAHVGIYDEIILNRSSAGSWYVAIVLPSDVNTPDLEYELIVDRYLPPDSVVAGGGCSISRVNTPPLDPLLGIIALLAMIQIIVRRNSSSTPASNAC